MSPPDTAPVVIDGGDRACIALHLELRGHLTKFPPGTVIYLTARNPAAPLDLAAWCHLTGHACLSPVGSGGQVAGVDMTAEMLARSRQTAQALGLALVEFREFAEALPVADAWADVVISNGVINLCAELSRMFGKVEEITGRTVPAERRAELLEAHMEASEVPRTLRRRLEAVQAELAETIKRDADLTDHVNELQEEIASLERQLMAVQGSGRSDDQDSLQSGQDPDTQREQELRCRLVQAKQDLDEALTQQRENHQELRECAKLRF
jgi:tRNA 2-thiouridine synthesizing protein A